MVPRKSNWVAECIFVNVRRSRIKTRDAVRALKHQLRSFRVARRRLATAALSTIVSLNGTTLLASDAGGVLPAGANVVAGAAAISTAGNIMDVNASTAQTIINWDQFSIGASQTTNFNLPDSTSSVLNRVTSPNLPSVIDGALNSNGQVMLVNPSGIMVGAQGMVNTNAFVATTFDVTNEAFLSGGPLAFTNNGSDASVVNAGTIETATGGAHLIANQIENSGTITSTGGSITLARGGTVTLSNGMTYIQPRLETLASGVSPTAGLINNTGVIRATGAVTSGGEVYLVNPSGKILHDGTIESQTTLAASDAQPDASPLTHGGHVQLEAEDIVLGSNSNIDASGTSGGGTVLVGGDWMGSGVDGDSQMTQATTVTMEAGATIDASATDVGDGGTIVLWSEVGNEDSLTTVAGSLQATGGADSGDGGKIETSGNVLEVTGISVDASATDGKRGLWLLDPTDLTIDQTLADTIATTLNTGTDSTQTTTGSLTWAENVSLEKTAGGEATLTLKANEYITFESGSSISSSSDKLNIVLWAGADGLDDYKAIESTTTTFQTNGGHFHGGGGTADTEWNGLTVAAGRVDQLYRDESQIQTGGGDVYLSGYYLSGWGATNRLLINAGSGDVTFDYNQTERFGSNIEEIQLESTGHLTLKSDFVEVDQHRDGSHVVTEDTYTMDGLFVPNFDSLAGLSLIGNDVLVQTEINVNGPLTIESGGTVRLNEEITVNGAMSVNAAGNITLEAPLTLTKPGAPLTFKSERFRSWADSNSTIHPDIQTNNGDFIIWTTGSYARIFGDINTANGVKDQMTGGGDIIIGGGLDADNDGRPDGYAVNNGAGSFDWTSGGVSLVNSNGLISTAKRWQDVYSGGGDIIIRGSSGSDVDASTSDPYDNTGIRLHSRLTMESGHGTILLDGKSKSGHGIYTGNSNRNLIRSYKSDGVAITINGSTESSFKRAIDFRGQSYMWIMAPGAGGEINITSDTGDILVDNIRLMADHDVSVTSPTSITFNEGDLGSRSDTSVPTSTGDIVFTANDIRFTDNMDFVTSGTLTFQPFDDSFSNTFNWPLSNNMTLSEDVSGLTLGKTGNTSAINVNSEQSIAGDVTLYGGNVRFNESVTATNSGTITVHASGAVSQGTNDNLTADKLLIKGTGNVNLTNPGNDVGTFAAATTGNVAFTNADALTVATVTFDDEDTDGITTGGTVDVSTRTGNLTVSENITSTADSGSTTIVLNAGAAAAAKTASGGDLVFANGATVNPGEDNSATLYSGSVSGSTGVAAIVGNGSGNFRYASDETNTNFTKGLGDGISAIFREQPTAVLDVNAESITYGDAQPEISSGTGLLNGDTLTFEVVAPELSGAGVLSVGTYDLDPAAAGASLGYIATAGDSATLTVGRKSATVSGIQASDKVYDGLLTGTANHDNLSFTGVLDGDSITAADTVATFQDKNVGSDKTVTLSGTVYAGDDASNYTFQTQASSTASITKKSVTVTGIAANDKVYDGTITATINHDGVTFDGMIAGDQLTASGSTGTFDSKNVGEAVPVTISGTVYGGTDIGNYSFVDQTEGVGEISRRSVSVNGIEVADKVYDGNRTGVASFDNVTFAGIVENDDLSVSSTVATFSDKNVGDDKTVAFANTQFSGTDVGNYTFTEQESATASITPKQVTVSGITGNDRVYDGTTQATVKTDNVAFQGMVAGDVLKVESVDASFGDKNVGEDKQVSLSDFEFGGTDVGNYTFVDQQTTSADITRKSVTVSGLAAVDREYNGGTEAQIDHSTVVFGGIVAGDDLTVTGTTGQFADRNVGTDKQVTLSGSSYGGADVGNYEFTDQLLAMADILRRETVTWIGGDTGDWANPANWEDGAIPDLANVRNVVISEGTATTFGSDVNGPVQIETLNGGSVNQSGGSLNVNQGVQLQQFTQSGGSAVVTGNFQSEGFAQTGGTTSVDGTATVTDTFRQMAPATLEVTGDLSVTNNTGDLVFNNVQGGGKVELLSPNGGVQMGELSASGPLTVNAGDGGISQSTGKSVTASQGSEFTATENIVLEGPANDFEGPVDASGDMVVIVDQVGGLQLGDVQATGDLELTSTNGSIDQTSDSKITAGGTTSVMAHSSPEVPADVVLGSDSNDFQGTVHVAGDDVTLTDGEGGIVLGLIDVAGDFLLKSLGGPVTQTSNGAVQVAGTSDLTASVDGKPDDITLNGGDNSFGGKVNVSSITYDIQDKNGDVEFGKVLKDELAETMTETASTSVTDTNTRYTASEGGPGTAPPQQQQIRRLSFLERVLQFVRNEGLVDQMELPDVKFETGEVFLQPKKD